MWLAAGVHLDTLVIIVPVVIVIWKIGYGWLLSDLRDRGGELRSARS
jgi:hypothetical protein